MKYTVPPGVFDITPSDPQEKWKSSYLWAYVEKMMREVAYEYGYQEIRTPIFERTELFLRSVGETSDIVSKEMYTFEDKGGRSMSLRPEGTAPIIRSFIENHSQATSAISKVFYIAPMFRYERSQAGRYRQHHQFGAEAIGYSTPEQDVEMIDLLYTLYRRLGITNLVLHINSIGDETSRQNFRKAFKTYLTPHLSSLSVDSQKRFETNPFRILDSKDPADREIIAKAPSILDFLSEECRSHFERITYLLNLLNIPYYVNPFLVRGLDYYNKTVFEFVAGELGSQNSIGGGGRYDGLIHSLGGPDLPSIGFGTGIERIIQTMIKQEVSLPSPPSPLIFLIAIGEPAKLKCFSLLHQLRQEGVAAQMDFSERKLGKSMQYADQLRCIYVAVIGDQEIADEQLELKEMKTGNKIKVKFKDLSADLKLEAKKASFIRLWQEMSLLFRSEGQGSFFMEKLKASLADAKMMTEQFASNLDKLKNLVEE